jgi:hypothetical protein
MCRLMADRVPLGGLRVRVPVCVWGFGKVLSAFAPKACFVDDDALKGKGGHGDAVCVCA